MPIIDNTETIVKLFNDSRVELESPELCFNAIKCIIRKKDTDEDLLPLYNGSKTRTERVIFNSVVTDVESLMTSLDACKKLADCIPGLRVYYGVDIKSAIKSLVETYRCIMNINEDIIKTKVENLPFSQFSLGHKILGLGSSCINKATSTVDRKHMYYVVDCDENYPYLSVSDYLNAMDEIYVRLEKNNIKYYKTHTPNGQHIIFNKMDFLRKLKYEELAKARKNKMIYATTEYDMFMRHIEDHKFNLLNNAMTLVYYNKPEDNESVKS